jgi:polar amino acid transport system substrate-binding protein
MKHYLLILLLFNLPLVLADDKVVSLRADMWMPISGDPNTNEPGYMVELAEKVFTSAGMTIDYQVMPWTRAINAVSAGEIDCILGTTRTNTPNLIFPTQSWGIDTTAFFVKKTDDWKYQGFASLEGRQVGVVQDYLYGETIDKYIADHPQTFKNLSGQDALSQNIRKLLAGRIDTILDNPMVINATLKKLQVETQIKAAGNATPEISMDIACSPANKERSTKLVKIIDTQTEALRRSGELAKILTKYGLKDWQ